MFSKMQNLKVEKPSLLACTTNFTQTLFYLIEFIVCFHRILLVGVLKFFHGFIVQILLVYKQIYHMSFKIKYSSIQVVVRNYYF